MTAHQAHQPPPARQSATPVRVDDTPAEASADVIVVGAGGGGLPTALFSRWLGDEVILLEKADQVGGTARKAAFWYWIPGNEAMRTAGIDDPREDFLRYVSRLSRPTDYDPQSPTLGLDTWSYQQFEAIYDSASIAAETLREHGALPYRHVAQACDYWAELPENAAPRGRVLIHEQAAPSMADGGLRSVESMTRTALADGISLRTGHRVQRLVVDGPRVAGVEATDHDGRTVRFLARKAVIFATGGFTHDAELRKNYLSLPLYPGCGARTNEGDFVRIAGWAGAQLRNMNYAWMCPISLEGSIAGDPALTGVFSHGGDSMIMVDAAGRRVVNEKLQYNELAQEFLPLGSGHRQLPQPGARLGVGPTLAGAQRQRRLRQPDRARGGRSPVRDPGRHPGRTGRPGARTPGSL
ncbi:MAG: FAD-dependent oxidoreductase [Nakamurella multipartita]